jgi:hypothetical protein
MLFLSYAEEDGPIAQKLAEWLRRADVEFYMWEDPSQRGGRWIPQIERRITEADAFLALMSPSFISSPWCHRESELAILREEDLAAKDSAASFIRVLQIGEVQHGRAGLLRLYDWLDLTSPSAWDDTLKALVANIRASGRTELPSTKATTVSTKSPSFRNRDDELERVLRGLTNAAGPHFWLVIAPPQLGKTWFIDHVAAKILEEPVSWTARRVDLREHSDDVRADAATILMHLFDLRPPVRLEDETFRGIAQGILAQGKPHLCLLDSAELLGDETTATLRSALSQIYKLVQRPGNNQVRLGVIVAGRRDAPWRGVTPSPRISPLPLTEFTVDVIKDALDDLAHDMGSNGLGLKELQDNALLVHRLTEGLPALLVPCLRWIQREQWLGMERLASLEPFERLAQPYIHDSLLSRDSLLPSGGDPDGDRQRALRQGLRVLTPYRLFTQSHLRHHIGTDSRFRGAFDDTEWSMEDLWDSISHTALLERPLDEPWQQIQRAIRRLLCRYFYKSDEQRADAHRKARVFAEIWSDGQNGKEQAIGLVECLWHEAAALKFSHSATLQQELPESARTLALSLRPSSAYTAAELREYAVNRMQNDDEFEDTLSEFPGLFSRLVRIVAQPEVSPDER